MVLDVHKYLLIIETKDLRKLWMCHIVFIKSDSMWKNNTHVKINHNCFEHQCVCVLFFSLSVSQSCKLIDWNCFFHYLISRSCVSWRSENCLSRTAFCSLLVSLASDSNGYERAKQMQNRNLDGWELIEQMWNHTFM